MLPATGSTMTPAISLPRFLHRANDVRMRVTDDRGTPRADVIDVALAVRIPQIRTVAAREKARRSADRAKRANRRIHARGNRSLRTREELVVAAHEDIFVF